MFTGTPTPILKLPQYNPHDHPDFLTEINKAFATIDKHAGKVNSEITVLQNQVEILQNQLKQLRVDAGLTNVSTEREEKQNG